MQLYKSNFITQSNFNTCQKSCLSHCKALNSDYWTGFGFGWKTLTINVHEWWMNMNEQIEFILSLKSLSLTICNECMYLHVFTGGLLWTICYQRWASPHFLNLKEMFYFYYFRLHQPCMRFLSLYTVVLQVKKMLSSNKLTAWILIM